MFLKKYIQGLIEDFPKVIFFLTKMLIVLVLPKVPPHRIYPIDGLMPNIVLVLIDNRETQRIINKREIQPIINQHEWKSVSFSSSLDYSRFKLLSLKEVRPLMIKPIVRKIPLQECLGRLVLIFLDQDTSNQLNQENPFNQLNQENPFYRELNRDDLIGISWIQKELGFNIDEFDLSSGDSEDEEERPRLFTFFVRAVEPLSSESSDQEEPLALPVEIPENTPTNPLYDDESLSSESSDEEEPLAPLALSQRILENTPANPLYEFDLDLNRQGLISYKNSRFNPYFEDFDNDEDFHIFNISFESFLF